MNVVHVRRHAFRLGDSPHISQLGIEEARESERAPQIGAFDLVVTSRFARTWETSAAMGFAVGSESALLDPHDDLFRPLGLDWSTAELAAMVAADPALREFARNLRHLVIDTARRAPRSLLITHSGVAELCLLAFDPTIDSPLFRHLVGGYIEVSDQMSAAVGLPQQPT